MDDADAVSQRLPGICKRIFLTADKQFAGISLVNTGNNFDDCGFSRPVFTEEDMHFSGIKRNGNVRQRLDAGEGLADIHKLHKRVRVHCFTPLPKFWGVVCRQPRVA